MVANNQKENIILNYSLLIIETISISVSFSGACLIRNGIGLFTGLYSSTLFMLIFLYLILYLFLNWNHDLFSRGYYQEFEVILKYNVCLILIFSCYLFLSKKAEPFSRLVFVYFFVFNIVLTYLGHIFFKRYMLKFYKISTNSSKVMIITLEDKIMDILKNLEQTPGWSFQITSIAILDQNRTGETIGGIPVVASKEDLIEAAKLRILDEVFLYLPDYSKEEIRSIVTNFEYMGVSVHLNIDFFDIDWVKKTTGKFADFTVMTFYTNLFDYRMLVIKRIIDILGAVIGLAFTVFLAPFVAFAIKMESKGPVFFKQNRIGKNGRVFQMYKFRSMYIDAEERKKELMSLNEMKGCMFKMTDDPRITKVGKFIRKTSIDELPQFWNILKGDMSLVGTRPPTAEEFQRYKVYYRRRLSIKPGLTGLWQVSGRSKVTDFEEVVRLDLEYIDNWSLALDFKLMLQTVWVVLTGRGSK